MSGTGLVVLVVRCGLVLLFLPFSALDKLLGFDHAVALAQQRFKPRSVAIGLVIAGLAIEVCMSLGVITGIADRACAVVLAGYCAATAMLFKPFWKPGDFFANPDGKARRLFWDCLKNLSLGAGFLLIVIGTDGSGLQPFLDHPFDSSHPYSSTASHP